MPGRRYKIPGRKYQIQVQGYNRKYELCNIRGAFNKFPDFFVQVSKIVVDSLKIQYFIAIYLMR